MAASGGLISESSDVSQWLKNLPLAPEYHPTPAEFQDPIAYIFKIEKEAANYGICKIVPPVVSAPKKTAISNLNRSLAARSASKSQPTFTTRQQQIGFCPRKPCPVKKPVWESGDDYTFQEFEAKAKAFERNYLKKCTKKAALSPLEIETLYWKATVDKPFSVEYANDMPGSAFSVRKSGGKEMGEGVTVGETEWNMRGVSRAKGSLLRFMKEEIPGVTSPMVYIAMMFSWFAWHVEDHDLHSLNYLHMGAGKTWYGVPREAAVAFEDVVRVHGYGGEINPLVTFSVLGEKTTIMSPEVFVSAGVPCCRLVQNAGEFVVTFPRAYHSGFSHGFNCGEAANIATPEWLKVAKDAAVRRASINCPPMVSHFQLLYDLALELCTRIPMSFGTKPRSSRLKNKKKGEGETLIKQLFVENVVHNNDLLHKLGKGSSVILLPRTCSETSVCSNSRLGSQLRASPSLGFCRNKGIMKSSESSVPYETENFGFSQLKEQSLDCGTEKEENGQKLSDQRLFSCATCGILSFDCVAVVRPREEASRYLMSADCSFLNDWIVGSDGFTFASGSTNSFERNPFSRSVENDTADGLYHVPVKTINCETRNSDQNAWASNSKSHGDTSALGLLASNYANSSDSEDEMVEPGENCMALNSALQSSKQECHNSESASQTRFSSRLEHEDESIDCHVEHGHGLGPADFKGGSDIKHGSVDFNIRNLTSPVHITSNCSTVVHDTEPTKIHRVVLREDTHTMFPQRTDEQSSRIHVFCLEHAIEVEQRFSRIGGVHILLLCHPEYPKIEAEAKLASEELGIDYLWNDITFRDPTREDEENIQSAFDSEEATPGSGDWAVKMGINLFYSANLSRSSLYSKQMPYNSVIYDAFGYTSPASSPSKLNVYGRKRKVVVGRWCGKVWMSNQVHPFLIKPDTEDLDYEHEQDRSFSGWNIRDEKFERKLKNICNTKTTLAATKSARKRKKPMISGPAKKVKCLLAGDAGSEDSEEGVNCKQDIRVYSRKHKNHILREISCDSLKDGRKLGTVGEREYEGSDNSLEGNLHRRIRRKPAKYIDSDNDVSYSQKQKNRFSRARSKKVKYVERDSEISNDSLDGEIHDRHRRFPRRTQSKYFERENAVSDDSLEQSSPEMVCRGKRGAFNEKEDRNSDDSVENSSLQQSPMISGSREHEEVSDDFDREGENSDDSLENNMDWKRLRTLKGKKAKFVEREDSVSGCLLESNIQCQPWVVPRSKRTKFIESEDRISDEFSEDNACLKHFRIPRIKEDRKLEQGHISNDLQEEDTRWRPTNRSRRLPVTSLTVTSNDEDDDTHWQTHKTSRSKERKIVPKMKREAPRQRGNAQLNNKVTSQVTKQEKETTQLRNGKNQHHSRQFLSNIEDELEGGPSTRLRRRPAKPPKETETNPKEKLQNKEKKQPLTNPKNGYQCDIEGCTMSFRSKQELAIHKRNICPVKGCGKTFFSHKYLVQHRRVHSDDRPLKCPWKGCKMTFKWAWARTEHIRVHTGARPYVCAEEGCGQTFRFVSDFSRHKRKTGHSVKKNIA